MVKPNVNLYWKNVISTVFFSGLAIYGFYNTFDGTRSIVPISLGIFGLIIAQAIYKERFGTVCIVALATVSTVILLLTSLTEFKELSSILEVTREILVTGFLLITGAIVGTFVIGSTHDRNERKNEIRLHREV